VATGGDRVVSLVMGARKVLTSGTRLPERERLRGSAGAREMGRLGRARGRKRGRAQEREGLGRKRPNRGGFFFFSISISYFYFFFLVFLLNHYLAIYILK
jgi:hypothetical protein